jgi:hypothetical protein
MNNSEFWKNFNLGIELQISGNFIYSGLLKFDEMNSFYHQEDIFEFLYNISVGIERLLKINVILIEHYESIDQDVFLKSIKNHNHQQLIERISIKHSLQLTKAQNEFIRLLNNFYNKTRYDRFTNHEPMNYDKERQSLIDFIEKYLNVKITNNFLNITPNDIIYKRFIGDVIKGIVSKQYKILKKEAHRLNIFTYEVRTYSKAYKIFLLNEFTFENETRIQKELFIRFINKTSKSKLINFIKEIDPLEFENYNDSLYVKCLFDKLEAIKLADELELLDESIANINERIELLNIIDDENVYFGE